MSFPVAFHYGKTPPRTLLGLEICHDLLLFLVAEFPVLAWNGLEVILVASRSSPYRAFSRTIQFCDLPFESLP